jgi:hypothetical protein
MMDENLNIAERMRQQRGRDPRSQSIATRFTKAEESSLARAARKDGRPLREWAREVLLREARRTEDDALFTEVVAMRILLNNVLRPLALGQKMTPESFNDVLAKVRAEKRIAAREVMQQYTGTEPKEQ